MRILIVSASPRRNSLTFRFCQFLKNSLLQSKSVEDVRVVDFDDFDIPVFGKGTVDRNSPTPFQRNLISAWQQADFVVFCSPEYNWTANSELFTLFDQIGRKDFKELFENKVFASIGVSSGRGGRQPALDVNRVLSKVISFLDAISVVSPKILEVHEGSKNIGEDFESLGNPVFNASVHDFIQYNLRLLNHWKMGQPQPVQVFQG